MAAQVNVERLLLPTRQIQNFSHQILHLFRRSITPNLELRIFECRPEILGQQLQWQQEIQNLFLQILDGLISCREVVVAVGQLCLQGGVGVGGRSQLSLGRSQLLGESCTTSPSLTARPVGPRKLERPISAVCNAPTKKSKASPCGRRPAIDKAIADHSFWPPLFMTNRIMSGKSVCS